MILLLFFADCNCLLCIRNGKMLILRPDALPVKCSGSVHDPPLSPDVTVELVKKYENIKGYKDTQAGMDHTRELIRRVKAIRPDFEIYSGFDDNFAHNILAVTSGVISHPVRSGKLYRYSFV